VEGLRFNIFVLKLQKCRSCVIPLLLAIELEKKILHRQLFPLRGSSSAFWTLNEPVYDPHQRDGQLNLTASACNQLGQYTRSPGRRSYYTELALFFPSGGCNHRQ